MFNSVEFSLQSSYFFVQFAIFSFFRSIFKLRIFSFSLQSHFFVQFSSFAFFRSACNLLIFSFNFQASHFFVNLTIFSFFRSANNRLIFRSVFNLLIFCCLLCLSHDYASGRDIPQCNKIDKPLVVLQIS